MRTPTKLSKRVVSGIRQVGVAEKHERRRPIDWSDRALKPLHAQQAREEAERLLSMPEQLVGSPNLELVAAPEPTESCTQERLILHETLNNPDVIAVDAAEQRCEVATRAGVLSTALDAVVTAKAQNSLERMLLHHMAAAHVHGMELLARVAQSADLNCVDLARLSNAASRLFETYQSGALTLLKLRNGGQQRVVVEHQTVNVAPGGQAVVAQRLHRRSKGRRRGSQEGRLPKNGQ